MSVVSGRQFCDRQLYFESVPHYIREIFLELLLEILWSHYVNLIDTMAIPGVEFSWEGCKIRKVLGKKSTIVKCNYQILMIGVMTAVKIWASF